MTKPGEERIRLSAAQLGIWFAQRMDPDNPRFTIAQYVDIPGPLDAAALRRALSQLLAETEALRTRFETQDELPHQIVQPPPEPDLPVVDLTREPDPEWAAAEWMRADQQVPHDLTTGTLFSTALLRLAPQRWFFYQRVHHLLVDGYGARLLVQRLAELHRSFAHDDAATTSEFGALHDLVQEDAEYRESERFEDDGRYWRELFSDRPEVGALSDSAAPLSRDKHHLAGSLAAQDAAALRAAARGLGTDWSAFVIAATAMYLHRSTGRRDVVLGLPVTARRGALLRATPGTVSTVLPLRVPVEPGDTVAEVVAVTSRAVRAALRHQRYRGDDLRRDLGLARSEPLHGPTVNILPSAPELRFGSVPATVHNLTVGPVEDLSIVVQPESTGSIGVHFEANPARYGTDEVSRHQQSFLRLLRSVGGAPETAVSALELLDAPERRRVLHDWNATRHDEATTTLPELFAAQADRTPVRPAVSDAHTAFSFAALRDEVRRLAGALRERGARPQVVIAALPRSASTLVALLAVAETGATYLPLDVTYPPRRIAFMLDDARPALVITDGATAPALPAGTNRLELDDPRFAAELRRTVPAPAAPPHPEDAAYLIYTSGSTGRPKGVVVEHRSLANLFQHHRRTLFADGRRATGKESLRIAHLSGVAFDASWDPVLWLLDGHEVHVVSDAVRRDPEECAVLLSRAEIDSVETTPSYAQALLAAGALERDPRPVVWALGGEPVEPALWERLGSASGVLAVNLYGPSESTVNAISAPLSHSAPVIGTPVRNTRAYVLDAALHPVGTGVRGELYLAGSGLARGYHDRTELTSERFVADPFDEDGSRMYRTGDLARWTSGGVLEFVGRTDEQVKIRGFRVELGAVETALSALDGVRQAAVVVEGSGAAQRLLAYMVGDVDPAEVRPMLRDSLPEHELPQSITVLPELPLTPNGKLDSARLPAPGSAASEPSRAPRTELERRLCALFAEVLDLSEVGVDDGFFTLGGHSLLVTRLVSRIRGRLGVEVAIKTVFEAPTPEALAARCGEERSDGVPVVLEPRERPARIPLSSAQQRMWFLHALDDGSAGYHIPMALRLRGEVDEDALEQALRDVLARHESLRTVFPLHDGVPHQRVLPVEQAVIELEHRCTGRHWRSELTAFAAAAFDLATEIPVRAALLRITPDEHVFVLVVHHIAADGWSTAPLSRDLATCYGARARGAVPQLAPLPVQYADYSLWQREFLGAENDTASRGRRQLDFWRDRLAGLPEHVSVPADRPHQRDAARAGGIAAVELPAELHARVNALAAERGASPFMVLHAGFAALLTRFGAGTDIPIGTAVGGRADEALDDLVGFFVNTLVLRADLTGDPGFGELLDRVRRTDLAAFDHQEVPFDQVVEEVAPVRGPGHPLFQVMFTLQNAPAPAVHLPGLAASLVEHDEVAAAKFDLSLSLTERHDGGAPDGITGTLEYDANLFEAATAERLSEHLGRLLDAALRDPERPVADLDLLTSAEYDRVVRECNDTARTLSADTIVEAFERTAARTPAATAVVSGSTSMTFAEVNSAANRIARLLRQRGAGAGDTVAVRRSAQTITALLAVLKTGATYQPVDLSYPARRVAHLLTDTAPRVVLTDLASAPLPPGTTSLCLDAPRTVAELDGFVAHDLTDAERRRPLRGGSAAYVIHTSGSTGHPKGVVVEHRSLANLLEQHREAVFGPAARRLGRDVLRVALTAATGFDASWDPVLWLVDGHELHVIDDDVRRDADALISQVRTERLDVLETTPSHIRHLLARGLLDHDGHRPRVLLLGGEPVDGALWSRLRGHDELIAQNFYGPTESTVDSVVADLSTADRPTIGRPVHNTRAYVLDSRLRPVPIGVPGELYLAGTGVARGYLGRAALTATRFVADPFAADGSRMYRTGDLARRREDGSLESLGRSDDQIKLRGFRIEPAKITTALEEHPAVAEAAVTVQESGHSEQRLVAHVVARGTAPEEQELRAVLARTLPDHMIPAAFVPIDTLPLTAHGKLDTTLLPPPAADPRASRSPRSPREGLLCGLFAEVLAADRVGIDDSFFELGGHSLLANRLLGEIRRAVGIDVPLRRLFDHPTVAGLAAALDDDAADSGSTLDVLLPLRASGTRPPLFCVHPASGLAWTYTGLLRHLPADQPVYGLQSRLLTEPDYAPDGITGLAADHIAAVKSIQPHGPYHLLGWSFGGNLAQEIAVQLEAAGDQVGSLILLDAFPSAPEDGLDGADEAEMFEALLVQQGLPVPRDGPLDRPRMLRAYREADNPMGALSEETLGAMVRTFVVQATLMRDFQPSPYRGDVLFFTALRGRADSSSPLPDWLPYLSGRVDEHGVDAVHAQLTRPQALERIGPLVAEHLAGTATVNDTRQVISHHTRSRSRA